MRVLGIDPGSRFLGYGVVELKGRSAVHVSSCVVKADGKSPLHLRLSTIFTELRGVFDVYRPDAVAVEGVFTHKNARSALILGHARGVALLLAAQSGVDVHEYAPARVKKAVGAGGNDSKESVARMVSILLRLPNDFDRADASDALAVALCHVNQLGVPRVSPSGKSVSGDTFFSRLKPSVVRAVP